MTLIKEATSALNVKGGEKQARVKGESDHDSVMKDPVVTLVNLSSK